MWSIDTPPVTGQTAVRMRLHSGNRSLDFATVINNRRTDSEFRQFWASSLCDIPFEAYCWEMPPLARPLYQSGSSVRAKERPTFGLPRDSTL